MKNGQIGILNVGAGDTRFSFDPDKPAECERAAKVVTDMLRRGYAILVQVGERDGKPLYMRAEAFDPATCEYLIVGAPADEPVTVPHEPGPTLARAKARGGKRDTMRVKAAKTRSVAVARSAGG